MIPRYANPWYWLNHWYSNLHNSLTAGKSQRFRLKSLVNKQRLPPCKQVTAIIRNQDCPILREKTLSTMSFWKNLVFKESALGRFFHRVAMSVHMRVCVSPFHVLDFEAYFAPTSRSRMSKNFRDSESLGKSAGKKWSQNWTVCWEVV